MSLDLADPDVSLVSISFAIFVLHYWNSLGPQSQIGSSQNHGDANVDPKVYNPYYSPPKRYRTFLKSNHPINWGFQGCLCN